MKTRFFGVLGMLCVLLAVSAARAEGDATTQKTRNYGSIIDLHYIYFILSHVQDLSLTNDQETKLKALRADMEKEIDALVEDPEKGAVAKKKLDAIVLAATQMLMAMKTPKPGKGVPIPITLSAFGVCAVLLAWLGWALWGHR